MDFIEMMKKGNNFRVAQEIASNFEEIKLGVKENFLSELREGIINKLNIEDIAEKNNLYKVDIYDEFVELYFYKESSEIPKNSIIVYGIGMNSDTLYFTCGLQERKGEQGWKSIRGELKNKFLEITEELSEEYGDYFEFLEDEKFDISGDNFYILTDEDRKDEREELINNLIEKFEKKHQLINEYFPE